MNLIKYYKDVLSLSQEKVLDEMYAIHAAMKEADIGFMELKSQNAWYGTLKRTYKKYLKTVIERDYWHFENETYKKKTENGQITFQIITQAKYLHLICVYAVGEKHYLSLDKAKFAINRNYYLTKYNQNFV